MTPELPGALLREALLLLAAVGGPVLGALLLVGLVVGVLQAATQVNDAAVGFLPRVAAAGAVIWLLGGWMMDRLSGFLAQCILRMAGR
ncbi:flagellar biosynthetic protein FliQ [Anaeromyxobacter dehalogenans]|uniref:Export protein FliQ, family 3 n=1 Tax=Anaeromyxobacter dehalogenans (strain 2CP-C) TaxID=290397 RepID=Q2IQQ5_ANADE|nr:flagellar biosynthetic protein FliQ [Anaeromyxobacter dehalogenans]ABC81135.1 export protein FliQ, family 3 [Anaeromyxobacter dehalogenans 2CP-C]